MTPSTNAEIPDSYNPKATEADIINCYRLLLNRLPDPGGFTNFRGILRHRSPTVPELVSIFLESDEFKQLRPDIVRAAPRFESLVLTSIGPASLYASPADWAVGKHMLETGVYEPHITPHMVACFKPGMTFIDIGANIGYFTMLAAAAAGSSGQVYAFEADAWNCTQINASLEANGFTNVSVFPVAVGDEPRTYLYDPQGSNGTILHFNGDLKSVGSRNLVRTVTLDSVISSGPCDVLKMDVEGAEAMVWKGARQLIRRARPVIFSEFSPPMLNDISRVSGADYLRNFVDEGYTLTVIDFTGKLRPFGSDIAGVIDWFQRAGTSHIDLVTHPV